MQKRCNSNASAGLFCIKPAIYNDTCAMHLHNQLYSMNLIDLV